jgi:NAD(P)-dependent dehydrogenase (short-subunit alcohol dehydrogenase family)
MSKVALVSGGTSGIGRAVAEVLAASEYDVVAFSNDVDQVTELAAAGGSIDVRLADVTSEESVDRLVADVLAQRGRIDALCNAAGVKSPGTVLETSLATWQRTFDVNVTGAFLLTKAVLPGMVAQRAGAIVNIGSPSGYGGANHAAYAASKGALLTLGASLAVDHRASGIRVNTVVPGSTRTGMNAGRDAATEQKLAALNVAGRVNEPTDVAKAVAFLLSDAAKTISGAVLEIGWASGQAVSAIGEQTGGEA